MRQRISFDHSRQDSVCLTDFCMSGSCGIFYLIERFWTNSALSADRNQSEISVHKIVKPNQRQMFELIEY